MFNSVSYIQAALAEVFKKYLFVFSGHDFVRRVNKKQRR